MDRARFNSLVGKAPLALSLTAFLIVAVALATGWQRGLKDEGAAAHLWQLCILLQAPLLLAYVSTADWRRAPAALRMLGLQAAGLALAMAPVAIFRL